MTYTLFVVKKRAKKRALFHASTGTFLDPASRQKLARFFSLCRALVKVKEKRRKEKWLTTDNKEDEFNKAMLE